MSTKRLSKTVIEGGRVGRNKFDRRNSHAEQRAAERNFMSRVIKDPEHYEEIAEETLAPVYKEFSDKLGPMYNWLDAQVGRQWSEVRSEIAQKFDTRTTAGRHITFDHLLASVVDTLSGRDTRGYIAADKTHYSSRSYYYFVNGKGELAKNGTHESKFYEVSAQELAAAGEWLAGRMIGERGGVLYWFTNTDGLWKAEWSKELEKTPYGTREGLLGLKYFSEENETYEVKIDYIHSIGQFADTILRTGLHWKYIENPAGFKQRGALTKEETKHFKSLREGIRGEILSHGKERF